eukprot:358519_1
MAQPDQSMKGGLFKWQKLPIPAQESIHYDPTHPRCEDIVFKNDRVYVSDYDKRVFVWEGKTDPNNGEPLGYELKIMQKYEYENKEGTQAGKRFDRNATSLAW